MIQKYKIIVYYYILDIIVMNNLNLSTNHPLISNSQEYMYENKLVNINSEDRDVLKYPNSTEFEIELPQDYTNVVAVSLNQWSFPSNFHVFTRSNRNISLSFVIDKPYNPSVLNLVQSTIYDAIIDFHNQKKEFIITIEEGSYTSQNMTTELNRKFNEAVTTMVDEYMTINTPTLLPAFQATGYDQFVIVYNEVENKLWYGNKSSGFTITNESDLYNPDYQEPCQGNGVTGYEFWGLPAYLGQSKNTTISVDSGKETLRFYYGDVVPGDNGYWIKVDPTYLNSSIFFIQSYNPINLIGNNFIYIEIDYLNNIDETKPFVLSEKNPYYRVNTNETNGYVNSAFAIVQYPIVEGLSYKKNSDSYKLYNPPAERIRKAKVRLRQHNGQLIDFKSRNFSILLNFFCLRSQNTRSYKIYDPIGGGMLF
jgi:hypothetical protein